MYKDHYKCTEYSVIKKFNTVKNSDISVRIAELLERLSLNPNQFATKLGYVRSQTVYDFLNGKVKPSFDFFYRLLNSEFSDKISLDWLIGGDGEMLKAERIHSDPDFKFSSFKSSTKPVPLVNSIAVTGFGSADFSISENDILNYYVIPDFGNIDFMIRNFGDSMFPEFRGGDIIACRIIHESSFIQWNKCHVLSTKCQGILVKRILKSERENCLLAVSDNTTFQPFDIPLEEITGIALVIGIIRIH